MSDQADQAELDEVVGDIAGALDALTSRASDIEKRLQAQPVRKGRSGTSDDDDDDILKRIDDPAIADEIVALRKRAATAEGRLAASDEETEIRKAAERISDEMPNLPVSAKGFAPLLRKIDKALDDDERRELHRILRASSAAFKMALETVTGVGQGDAASSDDPEAELDRLAKQKAEADGMPYARAYDAVLKSEEGRALYSAFLQKRGG